jgi:PAS domain S-box-containing protein
MMSSREKHNQSEGEPEPGRATDILFAHDLAGYITFLNEAGERILGYSCQEACEMNFADLVAPEFAEQVRKRLAGNVRDILGAVVEIDVITKAGERVALEVSTRIALADGRPTGVEGIAVPSILRTQNSPCRRLRCVDADFGFESSHLQLIALNQPDFQ